MKKDDVKTETSIDLELFFSVNLDLLCVADTNGTLLRINNSWAETLGYEIGRLQGSNFMDFVHPDDRKATLKAMQELAEDKPVLNFVNRYRHKNGSYRFIEWRSVPKGGLIYAAARDITERKKREERILQLSKAVEFNPATVIITDHNGAITYVNEKFNKLTGYSKEEVIGKNPRILKSGAQNREFYSKLWETITSGRTWRGEFHNRKKNGELYWESGSISPIQDEEGNITNYVALKEDVTLQKVIEERLEESNNRLDMFFRQSLDGFFFMMLDEPVEWSDKTDKEAVLEYAFSHQRITKINKAMLEQYGAEEKDFMWLTPNDFFKHDIPQGKKVWRQFFDDGKLHIDTQEQKFDGTPMIIEGDYICLYDSKGRITGHFGIQRDVTYEREAKKKIEESEERFRQLAENIDEVFFLRTEKEILYISPAYEKIWGRSLASLHENPDSFIDSIHPEDKESINHLYRNYLDTFNAEYRILRSDGEIRWILAKTFSVNQKDNSSPRIAGIAQDITKRKLLEDQLKEISIKDPLTGLYNRRHLFDRLAPLLEKSKRDGTVFSLAILDIDHFKALNDTHGHLAGDEVLRHFSRVLQENIRAYDVVGRFGGEEFLIIFLDAGKKEAGVFAERLLDRVRKESVPFEGKTLSFTFSCGVSDTLNCSASDCTIESIIAGADEKLYQAKAAGRNRVLL